MVVVVAWLLSLRVRVRFMLSRVRVMYRMYLFENVLGTLNKRRKLVSAVREELRRWSDR